MYSSILMPEFYQLTKQTELNILDVREVDEYENGHVPDSKNYPLSQLNQQFIDLDSSQSYHVICQSGGRSAMACEFLAEQGFNVTNVMGGTAAWMGELV